MQGAGTKDSPLVPTTWDEFIEAVGTPDKYVRFPDGGGTFNMNDIAPRGLPSAIAVSCKEVDFNGWEITNLYTTRTFLQRTGGTPTIRNLKLLDFEMIVAGYGDTLIRTYKNSYGYFYFYDCEFSGKFENAGLIDDSDAIYSDFYYSSINIETHNRSNIIQGNYDFCTIKIRGSNSATGKISMRNSYMLGSIDGGIDVRSGRDSVINVAVESGTVGYSSCPKTIIVNGDLLASGVTVTGATRITEAQMQDAAYLHSLGFNIKG